MVTKNVEDKMADLEVNGNKDSNENYVHVSSQHAGMDAPIDIATTEQWEDELTADPKHRLAISALSGTDPKQVLRQTAASIADIHIFNIKIALEGAPITAQKSTGRCWLFAATNVFRVAIMKRYNVKELELSQAYLFFWDKFEKANYFLEQIIETVDEPLEGRLVQRLMEVPVQDGGQWDMAANLVEKYGLVPQQKYPDSWSASNSRTMASLITTKLREYALELREMVSKDKSAVGSAKERMMREVHTILTLTMGPPPRANKDFTWEYYDKDDKYHELTTTPVEFAHELSSEDSLEANRGMDVHKVFSLVNDPRNPYNTQLSISRLGNVIGMRPTRYVNVDMEILKTACINMLKADLPIFFGCDVGKFSHREKGIMDTALFDFELAFNIKLGLTKAQRLMTGESLMTHAMVLTAVHVDKDGKPLRWRVQNSWGDSAGNKGWFVMTDRWMDEFVYQAVVDPNFVSKEINDILNKEPKMLPLWDPMGALA